MLGGGIHGSGDGTTVAAGAIDLSAATPTTIGRTVTTAGAATVTAPAAPAALTLGAGGTLDDGGALVVPAGTTIAGPVGTVRNRGTAGGAGADRRAPRQPGDARAGQLPRDAAGQDLQTATGTYQAELTAGHRDLLQVDTDATPGGTLALARGSFVPADGTAFDLVTCGGVCSGAWATVTGAELPAGRRLVPSYGGSFARVTALDVTAPVVTVTGPGEDHDTATLTFTADEPVTGFTGSFDGAPETPCDSPYTTPPLTPCEHTLVRHATDAAGKRSADGSGTSAAGRLALSRRAAAPTATTTTTTTPPPVVTDPLPPPPPVADPFQTLDAPAPALACTDEQVRLVDVVPGPKGKVTVSGAAATSLAGTEVTIVQDQRKTVGRATVAADGAFSSAVPAPRGRAAPKARYEVRAGAAVAQPQAVAADARDVDRGERWRGAAARPVLPPLPAKPAVIVIRRQTSCTSFEAVASVEAKRDGTFSVRVPLPPAPAVAAIYRAETSVPGRVGVERLRPTFTLPRPVDVR